MASSTNAASSGLGAQLLLWSATRLPPAPTPRKTDVQVRGPLKSVRKSKA